MQMQHLIHCFTIEIISDICKTVSDSERGYFDISYKETRPFPVDCSQDLPRAIKFHTTFCESLQMSQALNYMHSPKKPD